jgi:hypothetical protein
MIKNRSERSVYDQCWYVETDICRDGPFTTPGPAYHAFRVPD